MIDSGRPLVVRVSWLVRAVGLAVVLVWLFFLPLAPGLSGRRLAISLALAGTLTATAAGLLLRWRTGRVVPGFVLAAGAAAAALDCLDPNSPAVALPFVAAGYAAAALSLRWAVATVAVVAAVLVAWLPFVTGPASLVVQLAVLAGVCLLGMVRRSNRLRVEQAEQLVAQSERLRVAEARSGALAERARIARELHDVLAHSAAALALQLDAIDALLEAGQVQRARTEVRAARALAGGGIREARRAVAALGEEPTDLPGALRALAPLDLVGTPREITPETRHVLYRAAQEGVTNARKHAPGAPVVLTLWFRDTSVRLRVHNGAATGTADPLAGTGNGAGLAGMRARVLELGGRATAGPDGAGWTVTVELPLAVSG